MKKLSQYTFSLLFGLFTVTSFAEQKVQTPTESTPVVTEQVATTKAVNVNVVNINTATSAEIQDKLVGIGAKKAQAIVEYREKHGKFVTVEQITEVSGIGKATLEKNRDRIVIE
ncbi:MULTISPECIES: helix-hairpin-helix domain-containing protein [Glaesserella]|uniref:Transporter n=1 Tax=Glaesserella australis TaxID=2094024 RepID=A0A328BXC9_9PAST|nr:MULTISPECIES: helix-hairpin-helix domain-containing protein [Glaesserella]AUI66639.1 transporter [Glaesserella sp. 15-184]RAL18813.1 transporter [Glaesserella australis]